MVEAIIIEQTTGLKFDDKGKYFLSDDLCVACQRRIEWTKDTDGTPGRPDHHCRPSDLRRIAKQREDEESDDREREPSFEERLEVGFAMLHAAGDN